MNTQATINYAIHLIDPLLNIWVTHNTLIKMEFNIIIPLAIKDVSVTVSCIKKNLLI